MLLSGMISQEGAVIKLPGNTLWDTFRLGKLCFLKTTNEEERTSKRLPGCPKEIEQPHTVVPRITTLIHSSEIAVERKRRNAKIKSPLKHLQCVPMGWKLTVQ